MTRGDVIASFEGLMLQARNHGEMKALVACETHQMTLENFRAFAERYAQDIKIVRELQGQIVLTNGATVDFRGLQTVHAFMGHEWGYVVRILMPETLEVVEFMEGLSAKTRRSALRVLSSSADIDLALRLRPMTMMTAESR